MQRVVYKKTQNFKKKENIRKKSKETRKPQKKVLKDGREREKASSTRRGGLMCIIRKGIFYSLIEEQMDDKEQGLSENIRIKIYLGRNKGFCGSNWYIPPTNSSGHQKKRIKQVIKRMKETKSKEILLRGLNVRHEEWNKEIKNYPNRKKLYEASMENNWHIINDKSRKRTQPLELMAKEIPLT